METQLAPDFVGFVSFILAMIIVIYYAYLLGLLLDKTQSIGLTKKKFLWGLIPLSLWIALVVEQFEELD